MEWQPIETAPTDGEAILVSGEVLGEWEIAIVEDLTPGRGDWVICGTYWEEDGEYGCLARPDFRPTHWMPLPEAPK